MALDKVFPTALLGFEGFEADIAVRELSGGESLSGVTDTIATDGGGMWFVEASSAYLDEPEVALAWKALSGLLGAGTPIVVPLTDARAQMMGDVPLPPDGLPWWSLSAFDNPDPGVTVAEAALLRTTTLTLAVEFVPKPIRAGQTFSIDHTVHRHRAYSIVEVTSDDGAEVVVKFIPPLREAVEVGVAVEFVDPKCVMKREGDMRSPRTLGYAEGSVRFVEHFPGPGGYE